jgi:hypothetical protein
MQGSLEESLLPVRGHTSSTHVVQGFLDDDDDGGNVPRSMSRFIGGVMASSFLSTNEASKSKKTSTTGVPLPSQGQQPVVWTENRILLFLNT